jgi:peptidoglycan/xylan/chitin deacetylase (PgdA/CDA1 family)
MDKENVTCMNSQTLYHSKYTFSVNQFSHHIKEISQILKNKEQNISSFLETSKSENIPFFLTIDDGHIGSYQYIANILEEYGFRGYFFIITDKIGQENYMNRNQIYTLHKRGHVIGTHSCSHPHRMSSLRWDVLVQEWGVSKSILSEIIGEEVIVAAVPGGYYSKKVAEAAASVGIKALFTSEPTTKCHYVNNCLILGRYSIEKPVSIQKIIALAKMDTIPRSKQFVLWEIKKIIKKILIR